MHTATSLNLLFDPTYRVDVFEQLRRTANAGFKYIDMNFWDWGHDAQSPFMQDGWEDWVKRIKECGDELGVRFHQAHAMVYDPFRPDDKTEWCAEATRRSVIGAGMLGIDWIVFHGTRRLTPDESDEKVLKRTHAFLDPYVELCVKNNTGMAIENNTYREDNSTYLWNAERLCGLVDDYKTDRVGVCWDIGHAHCSKLDQYKELTTLAHRLKVLHVQDNNGQTDGHTAPFYGTVDWNAVKRALLDIDYKGEFTFEAHMIVRHAPDAPAKNAAMRLLYLIGEHIMEM